MSNANDNIANCIESVFKKLVDFSIVQKVSNVQMYIGITKYRMKRIVLFQISKCYCSTFLLTALFNILFLRETR